MRFHLVDRILEVEPGKFLRAVKHLTLGEEYLADHFPTFPVMPGVFMLQALVEAGSWLARLTTNYAHSVLVLREVRSVKYGTFMQPGGRMLVRVEQTKTDGPQTSFKGKGELDGQATVTAQFTLHAYNLRDKNPAWAARDEQLVRALRMQEELLRRNA